MKARIVTMLAVLMSAAACLNASAAWYDDPSVKASVDIGTGTDPHYINLSEDGAYLLVDTHALYTAFDVPALGWRKQTTPDVFTVTPIYRLGNGLESTGETETFTATYIPSGLLIIIQ